MIHPFIQFTIKGVIWCQGELNGDTHPKNKQEVGKRLALAALAKTYGKNIAFSGLAYTTMKNENTAIRLSFNYVQGLNTKNSALQGFSIAGADQKFY